LLLIFRVLVGFCSCEALVYLQSCGLQLAACKTSLQDELAARFNFATTKLSAPELETFFFRLSFLSSSSASVERWNFPPSCCSVSVQFSDPKVQPFAESCRILQCPAVDFLFGASTAAHRRQAPFRAAKPILWPQRGAKFAAHWGRLGLATCARELSRLEAPTMEKQLDEQAITISQVAPGTSSWLFFSRFGSLGRFGRPTLSSASSWFSRNRLQLIGDAS